MGRGLSVGADSGLAHHHAAGRVDHVEQRLGVVHHIAPLHVRAGRRAHRVPCAAGLHAALLPVGGRRHGRARRDHRTGAARAAHHVAVVVRPGLSPLQLRRADPLRPSGRGDGRLGGALALRCAGGVRPLFHVRPAGHRRGHGDDHRRRAGGSALRAAAHCAGAARAGAPGAARGRTGHPAHVRALLRPAGDDVAAANSRPAHRHGRAQSHARSADIAGGVARGLRSAHLPHEHRHCVYGSGGHHAGGTARQRCAATFRHTAGRDVVGHFAAHRGHAAGRRLVRAHRRLAGGLGRHGSPSGLVLSAGAGTSRV